MQMVQEQGTFPVTTLQIILEGQDYPKTEIVFSEFADKYLVLITQMNKVGTFTLAIPGPDSSPASNRVILGDRDDMTGPMFATQVMLAIMSTKPVVVGLGLQDKQSLGKSLVEDTVRAVCDMAGGRRSQQVDGLDRT
ncbi:hypothetical protein BJ742DRAFT_770540 [Cladochytrium replicatum]|nr:hypothetical protein BJ742DRAFT_770540 [Cladochytrium replicatum]